MIIVELISGLGNQLFQYAAGRALSLRLNTSLKIDRRWFDMNIEKQTPRSYGLDPFSLDPIFATEKEIQRLRYPNINSLSGKIITKLDSMKPYYKQAVYKEPHFQYDTNFNKASINTYLIGYWQSEKYFTEYAEVIRKDFQFRFPLEGKNQHWANLIQNSNAVSLHVRRSDMVHNPEVAKTHGSCSLDYYINANNLICEGLEHPEFFIFSDDPDWCKENLHLSNPTHYIDNNQGDQSFIDMQLMSLCKHHVIANSSFSWWGAWLNSSTSKRVIAPKRWFADDSRDTSDLLPSSWIRI
jgi:hypothetical protein